MTLRKTSGYGKGYSSQPGDKLKEAKSKGSITTGKAMKDDATDRWTTPKTKSRKSTLTKVKEKITKKETPAKRKKK